MPVWAKDCVRCFDFQFECSFHFSYEAPGISYECVRMALLGSVVVILLLLLLANLRIIIYVHYFDLFSS